MVAVSALSQSRIFEDGMTPGERAEFAASVAAQAAATLAAAQQRDAALLGAGIDLSQLNPELAEAIRARAVVNGDGSVSLGDLKYNGLGGDTVAAINRARSDIPVLVANNGMTVETNPESGSTTTYSLSDSMAFAGNGMVGYGYGAYAGGVVRAGADPTAALRTLDALSSLSAQMPDAPRWMTATEAAVFNRLVSETGDGQWSRLNQETLKGVLYSLKLGADGKLDFSQVFGGALGQSSGVPDATYATQRQLMFDSETGSYFYWTSDPSGETSTYNRFTPPDSSVGTIEKEMVYGGGDNGSWTIDVYKPTQATIDKYNADVARYQETFGKLDEAGGIQVRQGGAGNLLNIGVDHGYLDPSKMSYSRAFGLVTHTSNIKYPDSGGGWFDDLMDSIGDVLEVVVPVVLGAVFTMVGGPVGSFIYSYAMTDGDFDKALLAAVGSYVTSGMGAAFDGASAGLSGIDAAALSTDAAFNMTLDAATNATSLNGLAGSLGVTDAITGAAINNGASSMLQAIGSGGDLEDILGAGLVGAATGAFGSYITAEVQPGLRDAFTTTVDGTSVLSAADAQLANSLSRAIGNGSAGMLNAALTGGDMGNAALGAVAGLAGAAISTGVANELVGTDNSALRTFVQNGTSSLVSGLITASESGAPTEVVIGQALGAGLNGYIGTNIEAERRAREAGVQPQTPVAPAADFMGPPAPAPELTGPPAPEPELMGPPAPEPVAETAPPAETQPEEAAPAPAPTPEAPVLTVPDLSQWDWYDGGMPVTPSTVPAAEPPRQEEEEQSVTAANDNTTTAGSAAPSPTRTVVVESRREGNLWTLWNIAGETGQTGTLQERYRQIGQIMVANGLVDSTIRPGQELTVTPATSEHYSQRELDRFEAAGRTVVRNDNDARAERQRLIELDARERAERQATFNPAPTSGGSAPLPYTVPGAGPVTATPAASQPTPGTRTWFASLLGFDSLAVGFTSPIPGAQILTAPWSTGLSSEPSPNDLLLAAAGSTFLLTNSEGTTVFRGVPFSTPVSGNPTSWLQIIGRPGVVATNSDQGEQSLGLGRTWILKTPPGMPDVLGFMNVRAQDTPLPSVRAESGMNVYELSGNLGFTFNGNDLGAGALRALGGIANLIPTPQTQAGGRAATAVAGALQGGKYTVGSLWVGGADQIRMRFNADTGDLIGVYTPQGQQIHNPMDWLSNRASRAINALNALDRSSQPQPDLIDYRLVGP